MATVGPLYFTNVGESSGGGTHSWLNLTALLTEAGEATSFFNTGAASYSVFLEGMTYPAIPPDVEIADIKIELRSYFTGGGAGAEVNFGQIAIEGGSEKSTPNITEGVPTIMTLSGTPAYWGITGAEALEFVQGTRHFTFQAQNIGGSINYTVRVVWVQCTFTYRPTSVTMPCVF